TVETVFSSLEKLGCQNFNSRSVKGLESRFESILLAYSVLLSRTQRRFEGTLRYSLGLLFVKLSETKLSIYVTQKNF
ncbi:hypothetical protein HQ886_13210, partial [Enterococcus faecium]|nr:hypothetical protein [Enterococcus faecium]